MELFYSGGEINAFGELLESMGVTTISVNYMALRNRIKHLDKVNLTDRFSDDTQILLDSGCYGLNTAPDQKYTDEELKQIAEEYDAFVERHRDRLTAWVEFDALQLGRDWIQSRRTGVMAEIQVWHEEDGLDALQAMIEQDVTIGVTGTSLGDRDLTPILQKAGRENHQIYGLGMSKPEQMASIPWTGVTSTSWLSPVKFRDLIVWTGGELKRYPKKVREQGKKRHRVLFRDIGLDVDLIDSDDGNELLRLSIWSWLNQVADINKTTPPPQIVANPANRPVGESAEPGREVVANRPKSMQQFEGVGMAPIQRPKRVIPGMEIETTEESYLGDDGSRLKRTLPLVRTNSDSVLQCTGCYLAGKCPAFDPGSACVYDIPVQIRTKDQLAAVQAALMEMQVKRVMMMRLAEEVDGGYADPNLSQEIDRLSRMIKDKQSADAEGFSLTIKASQSTASAHAGAGVLSRIFGRDESEPARALPAPVQSKTAAEQMGLDVVEAEVVE